MENTVEAFYDEFTTKQIQAGISKRNIKIHEWAQQFGLKNNHNVLEIGCGIGTQTELLAQYVSQGKITAIDISPKSITIAQQRLANYTNVSCITGDIITMDINFSTKFDVIVLPDVIEHIPLDSHNALFKRLSGLLKEDGFILIHIPNPNYLAWCHTNTPQVLQVIDQPIYTNVLCSNVYANGFYIHHLETYEIWTNNCDYQIIVLKAQSNANSFSFKYQHSTLKQKIVCKLKSIVSLK